MNTNLEFPAEIDPNAIEQFKKNLERKGQPGDMIRIGVKGGGCSGLEYVLKFEQNHAEDDLAYEVEGLIFLCDPKSAKFLQGSKIVYTGNLMGGGFQFENPNAQRSCGCGTSFMPKIG